MSKLHEILSGKNINFLIGSGASYPIFKTLNLGEGKPTFEELLTNEEIDEFNRKIIYYYYYTNWVRPMKEFDYSTCNNVDVINNYMIFISKLLEILDASGNERPKRANIFTTNYDLLFENTFEQIAKDNSNCYFNDGSRGFIHRVLDTQCYNLNVSQSGYYDNYKKEVPTVNLIKIHGSVSWSKIDKHNEIIKVSYDDKFSSINSIEQLDEVDFFKDIVPLINAEQNFKELNEKLDELSLYTFNEINQFYENYKKLAIINPNKWKFYETVFEQNYYQLIRNFSYELEKENTVLIVFAFSFADEHIKEIFKRSLSNPKLQVIIICYSENVRNTLQNHFKDVNNIIYFPDKFISTDGSKINGNFTYLNGLLNGDYDE